MCAFYGYTRCSTKKQDPMRQYRNLTEAAQKAGVQITKFYFDAYTGTKMEGRKEWNRLMKVVKPGDTIMFDSVSRMSRNAEEGIQEYRRLYEMGVNLRFLKEPHIDTDVFRAALENSKLPMTGTDVDHILAGVTKFLMCLAEKQIALAFEQSEKEVLDLQQRTREGIITAKANGKIVGRPKGKKVTTKKSIRCKKYIRDMSKDFNGTMKDTEIMDVLGIARQTYYNYKKQLFLEDEQVQILSKND